MRSRRAMGMVVLGLLVLFGAALAFDERFVTTTKLASKPALFVYIYAPSICFGILGFVQFRRGRSWPAAAFAAGLVGTGLFHQSVIRASYGDPGYMFPVGHIVAPLVSLIAYSVSLLVAWGISRSS